MDKRIIASGKRKSAVAKAFLKKGEGKVTINGKDFKNLQMFDRLKIEEVLRIYEEILGKKDFDAEINVRGGGEKSQVEAARLALARGVCDLTKSAKLKKAFLDYDRNILVADVRRKETYKPGDSKARKKRQKSYR